MTFGTGTPVTSARTVTVHILAKRQDTFASQDMYIIFSLEEDDKYSLKLLTFDCSEGFTKSTTQTIDLTIKNIDAEEFVDSRSGLISELYLIKTYSKSRKT